MNTKVATFCIAIFWACLICPVFLHAQEPSEIEALLTDSSKYTNPFMDDIDVRLFAMRKQIANDLVENQHRHAISCSNTDFANFLQLQQKIKLANQALNGEELAKQWHEALKKAQEDSVSQRLDDVFDIPPPMNDQLLIIEESFARFKITGFKQYHFQSIEVNSLEARNAILHVEATGDILIPERVLRTLTGHPILLTYFLTKDYDEEWHCLHVHASFNPFRLNNNFDADTDACRYVKGFLGLNKRKKREQCVQKAIEKHKSGQGGN